MQFASLVMNQWTQHVHLSLVLLFVGGDESEACPYHKAEGTNACAGCPLHRCQRNCLEPFPTILHYHNLQPLRSISQ